ncbi:hypothetical protein L2E82_47898 [Cichorium intybus]|uniref:Uncharacterized protein n=1 Tax=Cichorium intybus TaxID=13427 RepID=A0ACB8YWN9_CICIN|nr:hypothetical protein L2E82_47898 [Cichorium intybus]
MNTSSDVINLIDSINPIDSNIGDLNSKIVIGSSDLAFSKAVSSIDSKSVYLDMNNATVNEDLVNELADNTIDMESESKLLLESEKLFPHDVRTGIADKIHASNTIHEGVNPVFQAPFDQAV